MVQHAVQHEHELGSEGKPRLALALQSVAKPKPIAKARPRQLGKPPVCTGSLSGKPEQTSQEELRARQAKLEQGLAEQAEFAKKVLKDCHDMPIDKRNFFGGAEGYDAKVRELEAIVMKGKGISASGKRMEDIAICNTAQHAGDLV